MNKETFRKNVDTMANKLSRSDPNLSVYVQHTPDAVTVHFAPRSVVRALWVDEMLTQVKEDYPLSSIRLTDPERKIVVVQFEDLYEMCGTGVARCSPADKFDARVGIAVAYAKWKGITVPDFV